MFSSGMAYEKGLSPRNVPQNPKPHFEPPAKKPESVPFYEDRSPQPQGLSSIRRFLNGIEIDDIIIIALILLLLDDNKQDDPIILIILAVLLFS